MQQDPHFAPTASLLTISLSAAVPLRMMELISLGGPSEADFERVQSYTEDLTTHGDDLLFRSARGNATAERFNQVADAIAVLAFVPGGITCFGMHFDGNDLRTRMEQARRDQDPTDRGWEREADNG